MTTDRELLELAAKSAGYEVTGYEEGELFEIRHGLPFAAWIDALHEERGSGYWNPLKDDGDLLRLAMKLRILLTVDYEKRCAEARYGLPGTFNVYLEAVDFDDDEMPAVRLAGVRAAAEIGKKL